MRIVGWLSAALLTALILYSSKYWTLDNFLGDWRRAWWRASDGYRDVFHPNGDIFTRLLPLLPDWVPPLAPYSIPLWGIAVILLLTAIQRITELFRRS